MKKESVNTKFLMFQLLFWGVFSLILSSTLVAFQNFTRISESFNLKSSAVDFSNATVISDGFSGVYWNDDHSYSPAVAVDSSNTVHVVWYDSPDGPLGTDTEIMYANYAIATGWSNTTVISDGFGGVYWNDAPSIDPAVAVDSSNTVHVVWRDYTAGPWGMDWEIMYAKQTTATGWTNATVISDGFGGIYWNDDHSFGPAVAVDNSNTVHVVWYDFTAGPWGTDTEIMYAKLTTATGWSNATVISDGYSGVYWNDGHSYSPAVAVDSSNTVHVVWYDYTDGPWGTDTEIMYAKLTIAKGWSNATVISDGYSGVYWNDENSHSPAVAVDNNNTIHVVWSDYTAGPWGMDWEIMYANYTIAAGWSNVTVISDGFGGVYWNDGISYIPAVAVDSSNTVHVVWYDSPDGPLGTDTEIMYANYTIATGWSNSTVISDGFGGVYWNDGISTKPAVAVDSRNAVHVVWEDYTDGPWGTDTEIMYTSIPIPVPVVDDSQDIPFGNFYILFIFLGIIGIIIYIKRKI
ncbi:hypothetical protein LCGC14_1228580 [marine sediment metagenome]|uniref:Uncharacterized protein n=1 Tax=marine sediment metagenome TaxID=412755 RepID=A0A0F9LD78_9ZZZZ